MIPLCVSSHIYMHSYSHSRFHTDCAEALEPGCLDQSLMSTVQCPLFLSRIGQSQPQGERKKMCISKMKRDAMKVGGFTQHHHRITAEITHFTFKCVISVPHQTEYDC